MKERINRESFETKYLQIITTAVCGTGKKEFQSTQFFSVPENRTVSEVLGVSVGKLSLKDLPEVETVAPSSYAVRVSGMVGIDIWYAYDDGKATDIARETIQFNDDIPISDLDTLPLGRTKARMFQCQEPNVIEAVVEGRLIRVEVVFTIAAEISGDTKVRVKVYD